MPINRTPSCRGSLPHLRADQKIQARSTVRNIVVVSDINEATSYVINNRFDLILADFRLEGDSTGADFIKVVRASYERTDRFVPIIACTADTTPAVIQRLRDAGSMKC